MSERDDQEWRRRLTTAFGWIAGGALGLLTNYVLFAIVGPSYPLTPTTFLTFVIGAFGGMSVADRWGAQGFRPLGIVAGVLLSILILMLASIWIGPS